MKQEVLQRLHSDKYQYQMNFEEYVYQVSLGLQLISKSGLEGKHTNQHVVNLALEYNMELMFETLMAV